MHHEDQKHPLFDDEKALYNFWCFKIKNDFSHLNSHLLMVDERYAEYQ